MKVLTLKSVISPNQHRVSHVKTSIRLTHNSPLAFPISSLLASYFSPAVAHSRRLGEINQSQSILFDDSPETHRGSPESREVGFISATERKAGRETGGMREPNGSFDMSGPMLIRLYSAF